MSRIAVAGIVNVRIALPVPQFPVPPISSRRLPFGIDAHLAGVGWNVATTLQTLGNQVCLATYVGEDLLGGLAVTGLRERGLYGPTALVCGQQPRAVVLYDGADTAAGTTDLRDTPNLRYPAEVFARALDTGEPCGLAVLTNIAFTASLIPLVQERGIPIATDLHTINDLQHAHNQPWMHTAHILACSHEQLPMPPVEWIHAVWNRYPAKIVIVGCGRHGALLGLRASRRIWHVWGCTPRRVRFTDGAGDTLLAAFAHRYLQTGDAVHALRHAVLCAGWKVGIEPCAQFALPSGGLAGLVARYGLPAAQQLR